MISLLRQLHLKAVSKVRHRFEAEPSLEDDIDQYGRDMDLFFENLIDYRAHLAQKYSEANFDNRFYDSFDTIEVVAICDWKMKILASKYREAQQGTSPWIVLFFKFGTI